VVIDRIFAVHDVALAVPAIGDGRPALLGSLDVVETLGLAGKYTKDRGLALGWKRLCVAEAAIRVVLDLLDRLLRVLLGQFDLVELLIEGVRGQDTDDTTL
jgi:hypothetical protein